MLKYIQPLYKQKKGYDMMFIDLDYICLLNDMYDDYYCECEEQGIEPLNERQWY